MLTLLAPALSPSHSRHILRLLLLAVQKLSRYHLTLLLLNAAAAVAATISASCPCAIRCQRYYRYLRIMQAVVFKMAGTRSFLVSSTYIPSGKLAERRFAVL